MPTLTSPAVSMEQWELRTPRYVALLHGFLPKKITSRSSDGVQKKDRLRCLFPKYGIVAIEPLKRTIVDVSEP
jgi:hypothetical protein